MITLNILKPYIDNAISELKKIDKVLSLHCDFGDKVLTFNLVISHKLDEEELEEARIAQTEVLAAYPDGEIQVFKIDQYVVSDDVQDSKTVITGEVFYQSDEMIRREQRGGLRGYKLIDSEKAEFEEHSQKISNKNTPDNKES